MAELASTEYQAAIVTEKDSDKFLSWERRVSNKGALNVALKGSNVMFSKNVLNEYKKSPTQVTKIPVMNKISTAIQTARSCTIGRGFSTSAFKVVTPSIRGFVIEVAPSINAGNYISDIEDWTNQFFFGTEAVYNNIDVALVAYLEANKNAALSASSLATVTANAYDIASAADLYLNADGILRRNKLDGPYDDIANVEASATYLKYNSYGANNQQNQAGLISGQFIPNSRYIPSWTNNITPVSPIKEVHYMIPEGTLGIFAWNTWEAKTKASTFDKKWYTLTDNFGQTWNVVETSACSDLSATYGAGREQTPVKRFELTLDVAFISAYSSDTSSNIIKFNVS